MFDVLVLYSVMGAWCTLHEAYLSPRQWRSMICHIIRLQVSHKEWIPCFEGFNLCWDTNRVCLMFLCCTQSRSWGPHLSPCRGFGHIIWGASSLLYICDSKFGKGMGFPMFCGALVLCVCFVLAVGGGRLMRNQRTVVGFIIISTGEGGPSIKHGFGRTRTPRELPMVEIRGSRE